MAREIGIRHSGRRIGVLAYLNVESPPDFPLEPNVTAWLTQDTAQYHDRAYEHDDRRALARWSRVCADIAKYDYYSLQWNLPRYFPEEIRRDLSFSSSLGLQKYHIEDIPSWPLMGPMPWIAARLLWNSELDAAALQAEFCRDFFGGAAEEMNRFFSMLQEIWRTPRPGRWFEGLSDIRTQLRLYPADRIRALTAVLDRAFRLAGSAEAAAHIDFFRRGWRTCVLLGEERDLVEQIRDVLFDTPKPHAGLDALIADLEKAVQNRKAGFKAIYDEPLLGGSSEWAMETLRRGARWDAWIDSILEKARFFISNREKNPRS